LFLQEASSKSIIKKIIAYTKISSKLYLPWAKQSCWQWRHWSVRPRSAMYQSRPMLPPTYSFRRTSYCTACAQQTGPRLNQLCTASCHENLCKTSRSWMYGNICAHTHTWCVHVHVCVCVCVYTTNYCYLCVQILHINHFSWNKLY